MGNNKIKNTKSKDNILYYSMKLEYIGTALRENIITKEEYKII